VRRQHDVHSCRRQLDRTSNDGLCDLFEQLQLSYLGSLVDIRDIVLDDRSVV